MDERDLLEDLRVRGDTAFILYGDWLEERDLLPRATIVREIASLYAARVSTPLSQLAGERATLLGRAKRLLALAQNEPADWRSALAAHLPHPLEGTAWVGIGDQEEQLVHRFLPNGILNYTGGSATHENGTWWQLGPAFGLETNDHYADHDGIVLGGEMWGHAHNINRYEWSWYLAQTTHEQVPIQGTIDRTVHRHR